ncbi:MAG TPA: PD-(D/E)XK nuclease family protein [Candidatus Limnocylindrales bacterium]|nr:PD-(D/E)XK nuclease family protein [Candidatus Limnocylindrales bacterium]
MTGAEDALLLRADERPAPAIIVRTQRLARLLRLRIAELRELAQRPVAETPDILTIDQWIERAWERTSPRELLLPAAAELAAWEGIIAGDARGQVLDVGAVASEAASAWRLLHEWSEPDWQHEQLSPETEAFLGWRDEFRQRAAAQGWVTSAELAGRVTAALEAAATPKGQTLSLFDPAPAGNDSLAPGRMVFVGFERLEPYVVRLREALRRAGTVIEDHTPGDGAPSAPVLRVYATAQDEARATARDIAAFLAERPRARVGVLVTDLERYRSLLEVTFLEELDPSSLLPGQELRPRPFDLAGAPALHEHCVIAHALDLLELDRHANPRALVSRILLAPYPRPEAGGDEELEARALTEAALRRRNVRAIDLEELARRTRGGAPRFAGALLALKRQLERSRVPAAPGAIARRFIARLQALGWPGADLQGDERVAFSRWRDALGALAALEIVEPVMTEAHARRRLLELCMRTSVQSPSAGLQVQVMGLLDSAGLVFDRIHVLGLDSISFPSALRPNALLPARWQREQRLPLASAEAELEFAAAVWNRVLRSAPEVHASHAVGGGEDELRSASSFVAALSREEPALRAHSPWYAAQASSALEPRPPETAVPALVRSGGTSLLVGHARCPFQSLAHVRLAADSFDSEQSEPASNTRGDLVHAALAQVLPRIGTRRQLGVLTDRAIATLAAEAAEAAMATEKARAVPPLLHAPTRHWLQGIVAAWLVWERDHRFGDWTFEMAEQRLLATFPAADGGDDIRVTCVVDRIDVIEGGRLLIDYKTGTSVHRVGAWSGERPDDAQLPIYAVAVGAAFPDRPVAGLAFAHLDNREKLELLGRCDVAQSEKLGPPSSRSRDRTTWSGWNDALAQMSAALGGLAASFARGDFAVDPLREANTCRTCRRQRLCRVFEGTIDDESDDAADEA